MSEKDLGDIFGDSDSDDQEFEGLKQEDIDIPDKRNTANAITAEDVDDDDDDDDVAVKDFKIPKKRKKASGGGGSSKKVKSVENQNINLHRK